MVEAYKPVADSSLLMVMDELQLHNILPQLDPLVHRI